MSNREDWISKAIHLEKNLDIQDRKYHLKTYKQCFVGSAAIYVIINLKYATNKDEAISFGNKLLNRKIIKHVTGKHKFKNENVFYEFVKNYRDSIPKTPTISISIDKPLDLFAAAQQLSGINIDEKQPHTPTQLTPFESKNNTVNVNNAYVYANEEMKTASKKQRKSISKLNGCEHYALHLFDLILQGSLFYYKFNKHLINNETQKTLITFIENYINGRHNLDDFNLNYFQKLFDDKIKKYIQEEKRIFINIGQVSSLNNELIAYFFNASKNDFKGNLFNYFQKNNGFEYIQFIEIPEIIQLNEMQIGLIKDNKFNRDILFKTFDIHNHKNELFRFYIKLHRKIDNKFHVFLYLKGKPENYKKVQLIWDFVCQELEFEYISKITELERNKCDEIEGFDTSVNIQSQLTFTVNIRIIS
eukprot:370569_1